MANGNDPWKKDFSDFKTKYLDANGESPSNAIFVAEDLAKLIAITGTTHIAIYPIPGECVAVAIGNRGTEGDVERKKTPDRQYAVAFHNCPPDCTRAPKRLVERVNLHNSDSID